MLYSILLAGVTAIAGVAAAPHPREHAHLHARVHEKRQVVVTQVVTQTVTVGGEVQVTPEPVRPADFANFADLDNKMLSDGDFPGGFTPGGFTPGGFTPRVTATGAQRVTLDNGRVSVSHLEQTLGLSTAARGAATPAPQGGYDTYGSPSGPVGFASDPSTSGPPTHPFEVLINEPDQPGPNHRDYPGTILLQTNFHRKNQSAPTVIWGFALQRTAQDIANKCVFQKDLTQQNGGYGQAIIAGVPADNIGKVITDTLYNPQVNAFNGFGQSTPDKSNFDSWGFFTQLVWKNTQQMACDTVDCSGKGGLQGKPPGASDDFTVCNFWPAGNVDGQYAQNVGPTGNYPTMNWDDDSWGAVAGN